MYILSSNIGLKPNCPFYVYLYQNNFLHPYLWVNWSIPIKEDFFVTGNMIATATIKKPNITLYLEALWQAIIKSYLLFSLLPYLLVDCFCLYNPFFKCPIFFAIITLRFAFRPTIFFHMTAFLQILHPCYACDPSSSCHFLL